jgi:hypothetical protein
LALGLRLRFLAGTPSSLPRRRFVVALLTPLRASLEGCAGVPEADAGTHGLSGLCCHPDAAAMLIDTFVDAASQFPLFLALEGGTGTEDTAPLLASGIAPRRELLSGLAQMEVAESTILRRLSLTLLAWILLPEFGNVVRSHYAPHYF